MIVITMNQEGEAHRAKSKVKKIRSLCPLPFAKIK